MSLQHDAVQKHGNRHVCELLLLVLWIVSVMMIKAVVVVLGE